MRQLASMIFAVALFLKHSELSVALPMAKSDDGSLEQDGVVSLLQHEDAENGLGYGDMVTKDKGLRVVVVATDPSMWRGLRMLSAGLPLHKRKIDENDLAPENRDPGHELSIPILRRDTMRCMVGRVYRPCWEV